jgi:hypothetical protein
MRDCIYNHTNILLTFPLSRNGCIESVIVQYIIGGTSPQPHRNAISCYNLFSVGVSRELKLLTDFVF